MMTVVELVEKLSTNCPPRYQLPVYVIDPATKRKIPLVDARVRSEENNLCVELITSTEKS